MQILMLGSVSPPNLRHALVLAVLAALGLVFELLVVKEELFPGGKDKICPAVHAFESLVLEFHERPTSPLVPPDMSLCGNHGRFTAPFRVCTLIDSARRRFRLAR